MASYLPTGPLAPASCCCKDVRRSLTRFLFSLIPVESSVEDNNALLVKYIQSEVVLSCWLNSTASTDNCTLLDRDYKLSGS